jgi:lysophospholipase L1-like esterase
MAGASGILCRINRSRTGRYGDAESRIRGYNFDVSAIKILNISEKTGNFRPPDERLVWAGISPPLLQDGGLKCFTGGHFNMGFWLKSFTDGLILGVGTLKSVWGDPDAWEASIRRFEAQDRLDQPPAGAIVFTGSSSFTLWTTLERDMAPLPVLNRGFGGARMADVVRYADRIVPPYRPRAVVLFAGTNDIAWPRPVTAQEVFAGYLAFVERVRAALPGTPLYYVAITPTPSRWKYWPIARQANRLIEEHTRTDPSLRFIDLTEAILGPDGRPDRRLYRLDRLHPSKKGYARWTAVIKPILEADLSAVPEKL